MLMSRESEWSTVYFDTYKLFNVLSLITPPLPNKSIFVILSLFLLYGFMLITYRLILHLPSVEIWSLEFYDYCSLKGVVPLIPFGHHH